MQNHIVLFDNSSFAGVMRCLFPNLGAHEKFLSNYPAHKEVDIRSFKEFLTAICIFDRIEMDSVCSAPSPEFSDYPIPAPWVEEMLALLPNDLKEIVRPYEPIDTSQVLNHRYACETAYDLFCSSIQNKIKLKGNEKLPNVYTSGQYVFRREFEAINAARKNALPSSLLAQAMFFHRGLYLQSRAQLAGYTYWPYLHRGRMLSSVSPLVSVAPPSDGLVSPTASQAFGVRPTESKYLTEINKFYYNLMDEIRWLAYDDGIPFIGEAIFAGSRQDPAGAIEKALEIREQQEIQKMWYLLREAIEKNDKIKFNLVISKIQQNFIAAATHLGYDAKSGHNSTVLKLASSVVPKGVASAVEAATSLLPASVLDWGRKTANHLLTKNSFHLLFIEHARALEHP